MATTWQHGCACSSRWALQLFHDAAHLVHTFATCMRGAYCSSTPPLLVTPRHLQSVHVAPAGPTVCPRV
jgi:hypothetical protein